MLKTDVTPRLLTFRLVQQKECYFAFPHNASGKIIWKTIAFSVLKLADMPRVLFVQVSNGQ